MCLLPFADMDIDGTMGVEPFETGLAPWLVVRNAQEAEDFYAAAFRAVELYRLDGDEGLAVAQLSIDGAAFWIQDDGGAVPDAGSIRMILSVADPDAVFELAVASGAEVVAPISEAYGWRTGRITDPFGHNWEISRQLTPP